jgi:hypothetical protein
VAKKIKYVGSKAVNKDSLSSFSVFNDSYQTTIFNGDIQLSTKFSINQKIPKNSKIIITQKNVTLNDLKITNLDSLNNFIKTNNKLKLNVDRINLSNYAVYGSLKEKYRIAVNNIINKFVGGLFMNSYLSGTPYNTLLDYKYNDITEISTFRIPVTVIENPFFINLNTFNSNNSQNIDNLITRYQDYRVSYNDIEYDINGFTGFSTGNSSYLYFSINGNPFSGNSTPQNIGYDFLIKPNDIEFNKFYDSLNELERYFLNKNSNPKYTFSFKIPEVDEDGNLSFSEYKFSFPIRYDGYNLDTESITYVVFLEKLFEVGDLYDEYKSNLIIRKFLPKTLLDLDVTNAYKSESMFKIYGKEIDEIKIFIDSLININATSYDKINNIPDVLIKNLARTLSWKAKNIINDKDLVSSVFANDNVGSTDVTATLAEVDIEIWRRLVINTAWFMKSKGTRKSIETIFSFIGAPECLLVFNEHVYVVDGKINPTLVDPSILIDTGTTQTIPIPYDDDGYPIAPIPTSSIYFQNNGNEDSGQFYINLYRKLGFNVTKTVDNKKSWVYYESANTHSSTGRNTDYQVNDSRLIINTKEVSLSLDIATAIECDVYNFNKTNNYPVTNTGRTIPYPQRESNKFNANSLTFAQYVDRVYSTFINAQNRKVSDSAIGSYYPSLTKLYYDYLNESFNDIGVVSNKRRFRELMDYVDNIDSIFDDFVNQFIPATTILIDRGTKIRNTVFTPQKFVYKQGIDDGSEFQNEISVTKQGDPPNSDNINTVIIESEFFDEYEDSLTVATISTEVKTSNTGNIDTEFFTSVNQAKNIQPTWDGVICENEIPNFNITGATKIELSSLTNNQIFNKTTGASHTISFNFTSATETLTAATTEFYFDLHKYDNSAIVLGFADTPVYTFSSTSSAFTTSTTISVNIPSSELSCDSEYIIKPYFKLKSCSQSGQIFTATTPYTMYEDFIYNGYYNNYSNSIRFFDYTKFSLSTGSTISSLTPKANYTPLYGNYNSNTDYYFVSNCTPDIPILDFPTFQETEGLIVETTIIQDSVFTRFQTQNDPIGDIVVAVNGITIQKGLEYDNDTSTGLPNSIRNRSFKLNEPLSSVYNDILTVSYYKNPNSVNRLISENLIYTGSTNINYNNTTLKYEIDLTYSRILNSDSIVYVNGLPLAEGSDYTYSISNPNKIVLNNPIYDETLINIVYFTTYGGGGTIDATGPVYQINWSVQNMIPSNITGKFTHQFYDITDTGFTGTSIYSVDTAYDYNSLNYNQSFNWIDLSTSPNNLVLGSSYLYRIASTKQFKTINNINLSSVTHSQTYTMNLPN